MKRAIRLGLLAVLAAAPVTVHAQTAAPPNPPAMPAEQQRQGDSRTQQALRRVLGVLMQQFGDLTGKVPESLNDADIAMREAMRALDAGDDTAAAAATQKAIEALQKGGRSMGQQLAQQFGRQQDQGGGEDDDDDESDDGEGQIAGGQDGSQPGEGQDGPGQQFGRPWNRDGRHPGERHADERRDPLGRRLREDGTGQSPDEGGVRVPDQMEQARAHDIQEELRRREAEKSRPQPELDYIERLLRQF
jgi:hypothetical protein